MLDTGRFEPQGQPRPMEHRSLEPANAAAGESARRAECLRRADAFAKLGIDVHLAVHDLRNLLSNAALNASLLARKLGGDGPGSENAELLESVRRDLRHVHDALCRVTQLTEDETPDVEPVAVSELMADLRRLAWSAPQLTGDIRITVVAPEEPVFVRGSRSRLHQAVFALVRNAIEASPASTEVRIEVEARMDHVHIRVRDNGPGLPPGLHERGFAEFESTKPTGLGIGLSVARHIIAQHAGSLTLESSPGSGTCAEVRLNLSRAARPV